MFRTLGLQELANIVGGGSSSSNNNANNNNNASSSSSPNLQQGLLTTNTTSPSDLSTTSPHLPNIIQLPELFLSNPKEHPTIEDEEIILKNNKLYKNFKDDLNSVLKLFDNTKEWADLIKCLQKLKKVLKKYESIPIIPEKINLCKRLSQCLNSSLPNGVHIKTLEIYEELFQHIKVSLFFTIIYIYYNIYLQ